MNDKDMLVMDGIKRLLELSSDPHNIFTPFELCNEVICKLPLSGSILVVANLEFVYTLLKKGVEPSHLYFATPCDIKAQAAQKMGVSVVYKYNNILTNEDIGNMKFDVLVGNPPYQAQQKANKPIYHKFVEQSLALADRVCLLVPSTFTDSTKPIFSSLRESIRNTQAMVSINHVDPNHFPVIVRGGIVLLSIDRKQDFAITFNEKPILSSEGREAFKEANHINQLEEKLLSSGNSRLDVVKGTNAQRAISPNMSAATLVAHGISLEKTNTYPYPFISSVLKDGCRIAYGKKKLSYTPKRYAWVTPERSQGASLSTLERFDDIDQYGLTINVLAFVVDNENELQGLHDYLTSKVFRFMMGVSKTFTDGANVVGKFRMMPAVDFTRSWTDAELYEHFNLTEEEINLIETTIK